MSETALQEAMPHLLALLPGVREEIAQGRIIRVADVVSSCCES